jgi:hypothetical protein
MLSECWYLHQNQDAKLYFDRQENLTKMLQGIAATKRLRLRLMSSSRPG